MTAQEYNTSLGSLEKDLKRYAISLTLDSYIAMDLVQDVYLKAIISKDKLINCINLKSYMFAIMQNTFIESYKGNKIHNPEINNREDLSSIDICYDKGFISPESNYAEGEIEREINLLNDKLRIPFKMHIEGYKYKEIAEYLGIKIDLVRSRISDARQKLKIILEDYNK